MSGSLIDQLSSTVEAQPVFTSRAELYDYFRNDPSQDRKQPAHRKAGKKRSHNRSLLGIVEHADGRRETLHATKGWRKMPPVARGAPAVGADEGTLMQAEA